MKWTVLQVLVIVVPVGDVARLAVVLRAGELGVHIAPGIHQKGAHSEAAPALHVSGGVQKRAPRVLCFRSLGKLV